MTGRELIAAIKKTDIDKEVFIQVNENDYLRVYSVREKELFDQVEEIERKVIVIDYE